MTEHPTLAEALAVEGVTHVETTETGFVAYVEGDTLPEHCITPPEDPAAVLLRAYDGLVQRRIDDTARAFGYGDPNRPEVSPILHAVSYADEPAVAKFQAEGRVLRAWRSRTWAACLVLLTAAREGGTVPTEAEVLAHLDASAPIPTADDVAAAM